MGSQFRNGRHQPAFRIEQLLRPVTLQPGFELFQMLRMRPRIGQRNLMRAERPLNRQAIHLLWTRPSLRRNQHNHRPAWALACRVAGARRSLDLMDLLDHRVQRHSHRLVHRCGFVPFNDVRSPTATTEELHQFLARNARQNRRIRDLVSIEMQDRQHGPVMHRIEKLVGMPRRGQRTRLGLAVPHHTSGNQIGIVEHRAKRVAQRVS